VNRTSRSTSLEGITVLADDVVALASFYRDALGLVTVVEEEFYVAFGGEGVRLEIFSRPGMGADTGDHADYRIAFTGQAFELNFQCASRPKGMSVSRGCPRTVPHRSHTRSRPTGATTPASLPTRGQHPFVVRRPLSLRLRLNALKYRW